VLADVAARAGIDAPVLTGAQASRLLFEAVPFFTGLTLEAIGGKGIHWPTSAAGQALADAHWSPVPLTVPDAAPGTSNGSLRLGTFRTLWASKEVDVSPILQFAVPGQVVELSPADADRLGIQHGEEVEVASNGHRVRGPAVVRAAIPAGSVFVAEGTHDSPANVLAGAALVEVRGTRELVGAPTGTGASGEQAEQAAAGAPYEEQTGDSMEVGTDQPHPAEDASGEGSAA
jgi:NADH-quinone oxidoreductase subunit G